MQTAEDRECRHQELLVLVQEYMYGYYPDHSLEIVTSCLDETGTNLSITASSANGSGTWFTTLSFLTNVNATTDSPVPVVICVVLIGVPALRSEIEKWLMFSTFNATWICR